MGMNRQQALLYLILLVAVLTIMASCTFIRIVSSEDVTIDDVHDATVKPFNATGNSIELDSLK